MARNFDNWIKAYVQYTSVLEAPDVFHIWAGVSTIAAALRGKCCIDMGLFQWKPNFFIIFVAPPGIVQKSTTIDIGMDIARGVDGIHFGPSSATWQALTDAFGEALEQVPQMGTQMSCLTVSASELGTFLDPRNREMLDVLNDLWDGRNKPWQRRTRGDGLSEIQSPCLNFIGCTTPSWIEANFPQTAIGGGFTSRTIFVYGEEKRRFTAYPKKALGSAEDIAVHKAVRLKLLSDLKRIASITGEFTITREAEAYGEQWYEDHWLGASDGAIDRELHSGYISRKQTHIHKTAMVLSAAKRDDRLITKEDLYEANFLVSSLEHSFSKVFTSLADNREVHNTAFLIKVVRSCGETGISKRMLLRRCLGVMGFEEFQNSCKAAVTSDMLKEYSTGSDSLLKFHIPASPLSKAAQMPSHLGYPVHAGLQDVSAALDSQESDLPLSAAEETELPH